MTHMKIPQAAVQAYEEAGLDLPTAYEGFAFQPPTGKPWARLAWLPADIDGRLQTVDRAIGILQIDLIYPAGKGTRAQREATESLLAHFAPRARFSYDGQWISVRNRSATVIRPGDGWMTSTVSVTLAAAVDRE